MDQIAAWLTSLLASIPGLAHAPPPSWNGYAEIDYAYVGAVSSGRIETIGVEEGTTVEAGDILFVLDSRQQQAAFDAATARAAAAKANLDNMRTGSRSEEIAVIRASLMKAEADQDLARNNLKRSEELFARKLIPAAQLDQVRTASQAAGAAVAQLSAQLKVAQLPARDAQQIAAEANLEAAQADAATALALLDSRTVRAPAAGRVDRLFFSAGEVANAGVPVLALEAGGALEVRFYLSEEDRQSFTVGQLVEVSCAGCPEGLTARISHFDSEPQFTPPILYSRDERSRLVFRTEAVMEQSTAVRPGQPVSIGRLE